MSARVAVTASVPTVITAGTTDKKNVGLTGVVCDDRPAHRRSVLGLFTRSGFDLATEADSFESLRHVVHTTRPTVAVLTLSLVGVTGLEAVRRLRSDVPESQVVLVSSYTILMPEAVQAGARALVPEDDPQTLLAVLEAIAATRRGIPNADRVRQAPQRTAPPAA